MSVSASASEDAAKRWPPPVSNQNFCVLHGILRRLAVSSAPLLILLSPVFCLLSPPRITLL